MINSVCVAFDEVAGTYSAPMTFANDEAGKRYIQIQAKKGDPIIEDVKLYKIGEYDSETGKMSLLNEPVLLIRGDQCEKA